MNNQHKVAFNDDQKQVWEILQIQGLTSQSFPDFVKGAFHNKVDDIRIKSGKAIDLRPETIEKLAQKQIMKITKKTIKNENKK